jgi:deazaflavin-dependent oxidoreductase (nitroreductase family)
MGGQLPCETCLRMAIEVSRRVARVNRKVTNPIQLLYAWVLPPWAVICHCGRRSGRPYTTPVNAYKRGDVLAVVILYGERSDWVQNVLAGGGRVIRGGRTYKLIAPRVVPPALAPSAPAAARLLGRLSGKLLVAELSAPEPGFGRGPRGR